MLKSIVLRSKKERWEPIVRPKNFVKKVDLNLNLARVNFIVDSLTLSSSQMKIFCSMFLKRLKFYKQAYNLAREGLGPKLQVAGFYTSSVEVCKRSNIKILRRKILNTKNNKIVKKFFSASISSEFFKFDQKNLNNLSFGIDKMDKFYGNY